MKYFGIVFHDMVQAFRKYKYILIPCWMILALTLIAAYFA